MKTRIQVEDISKELCDNCKTLIQENTNLDVDILQPTLSVLVYRMTFMSKKVLEKATLDLNIEFKLNGKTKDTDGLVIAEVKQDHYCARSNFLKALHQFKIYPSNISKYCLGVMWLHHDIKYNRFKPRLLKLNKVTHNYTKNITNGFYRS